MRPMARKARAEVEGGLYHVITRGNNRRQIFNSPPDYEKFLSLLAAQKLKLPFFLYTYCLMSNHVHLLIERRADKIGRELEHRGQACDSAIPDASSLKLMTCHAE